MGPLRGFKVIEFGSIGPAPFTAMLLADMGAEIARIDRNDPVELGVQRNPRYELNRRNRRSIGINLKCKEGVQLALDLIRQADALIEGFRPGVMERMGLGPQACSGINPRLVYGRMTGWGQDGPLAQTAGHDINYIALAGALNYIGIKGQRPSPPLSLLGDNGGGGVYLAFGIVCALLESGKSGQGQVVDAAIIDGVTSLATPMHGREQAGDFGARGENASDGNVPWYSAYETRDHKWVTVGAIESRFYRELLVRLGLDKENLPGQQDKAGWPALRHRFEEIFSQRTRDEWVKVFEGSDACFAPVLELAEVRQHPHAVARGMFKVVDGIEHPMPAPRFSRTIPEVASGPALAGEHTEIVLLDWGFSDADIASLRTAGAIT